MSNDAKCVCGHEEYEHHSRYGCLFAKNHTACNCRKFRPPEKAKEKCVCGHEERFHSGIPDHHCRYREENSLRCGCSLFRPAEEAKPESAPESVYERAMKIVDSMWSPHKLVWPEIKMQRNGLLVALDAGEKAEKRAEDAKAQIAAMHESVKDLECAEQEIAALTATIGSIAKMFGLDPDDPDEDDVVHEIEHIVQKNQPQEKKSGMEKTMSESVYELARKSLERLEKRAEAAERERDDATKTARLERDAYLIEKERRITAEKRVEELLHLQAVELEYIADGKEET